MWKFENCERYFSKGAFFHLAYLLWRCVSFVNCFAFTLICVCFFSPFLFVCPRYIQSVKKMDDMQFNTVDTIARICASIIHSFRPTSFIQLKKTVRLARRVLDNLWNACFSLNIIWFFFYSTQSFWVSDQSFLRWICLFVVNIWNDADEWGSFWNMTVGRGHHREFYLISTPWIEVLILYMNRSEFFLPRELKCCCFVVLLDKKKVLKINFIEILHYVEQWEKKRWISFIWRVLGMLLCHFKKCSTIQIKEKLRAGNALTHTYKHMNEEVTKQKRQNVYVENQM